MSFLGGFGTKLIVIALLTSCAPNPSLEELEEAARNGDAEADRKVGEFYEVAEDATEFYEAKARCLADSHCLWFCDYHGVTPRREKRDMTLEEKVRRYRLDRHACGTVQRDDW